MPPLVCTGMIYVSKFCISPNSIELSVCKIQLNLLLYDIQKFTRSFF